MQNFKPFVLQGRQLFQTRQIVLSAKSYQQPTVEPPKPNENPVKRGAPISNLDKKILVWTKKFKTIDEIPADIRWTITITQWCCILPYAIFHSSAQALDKARNQFRIKVCNYMIVGTIIACLVTVISGKKAQARGESVVKQNLDWHKEYNETNKKE